VSFVTFIRSAQNSNCRQQNGGANKTEAEINFFYDGELLLKATGVVETYVIQRI
jgi:hypothetical protein